MPRKPPPRRKGPQASPRSLNGQMLYGMAEACKKFGLRTKALWNRVARGEIPHRKLGGRIVFIQTEIDAFVAALPGVTLEEALRNLAARREADAEPEDPDGPAAAPITGHPAPRRDRRVSATVPGTG